MLLTFPNVLLRAARTRKHRAHDAEGRLALARASLAHRGLALDGVAELLVPMLLRDDDGVGLSARNTTYNMTM